jgi:hypothetical protein
MKRRVRNENFPQNANLGKLDKTEEDAKNISIKSWRSRRKDIQAEEERKEERDTKFTRGN